MKHINKIILNILLSIGIFIIMSCPEPLSVSQELSENSEVEMLASESLKQSGSFVIKIPTVSSYLLEALGAAKDSVPAESRALMLAREVEVFLYNSAGTLIDSSTGSNNSDDGYYAVGFSDIPYGGGYEVEVNVYNSDVSDTAPILTGGASNIEIGAGINDQYVFLIPADPEIISMSDSESIKSIEYDFDNDLISEFGGEKWYSFSPATDFVEITVTPDSVSGVYAVLYDSSGDFIESAVSEGLEDSGTFGNPAVIIADVSWDSTCYIGIVSVASAAETHSFEIQIGEPDPVSFVVNLSDSGAYESSDVFYSVMSSYDDDPFSDQVAYATSLISSGTAFATMLDVTDDSTWENLGTWYIYILIDADGDGNESLGDAYLLYSFCLPFDSVLNLNTSDITSILGPDIYEDDNVYTDAAEIYTDTPQFRSLHEEGDEDWVSFTPVSGTTYVIETLLSDVNVDTYLNLYNSSIELITSDDDGGDDNFSKITYTADSSDTLYIKVSGYNPSITGNYILSITEN